MVRVASIDCGTNSIRLLIADVDSSGVLHDVVRRIEIVRLGQGVDQTGRFDHQALERTLKAVADYAQVIEHHQCAAVMFAATSATRDAANRDDFITGVERLLGITPRVISGEEEARTSFAGALSSLDVSAEPVLVIDVGGGSTELVLGTASGQVLSAYSMDIGSVRMRERRLLSDPPSQSELLHAREDIAQALDEAQKYVDVSAARTVVGVAGTVTSVAAKWLGLTTYEPEKIHGTKMPVSAISQTSQWFIRARGSERAAVEFLHPRRADVMGAGALVWNEVVQRIVDQTARAGHEITEVLVSEHDILDGLALRAAGKL